MDVKVRTYLRFSRDIRVMMMAAGVCPGVCPILQRILAYFGLLVTVTLAVGILNFVRLHTGNILLIVKSIGIFISVISTFLKICVFLRYHDDLVYLNDYLSTRYRQDLLNPKDRPLLLHRVATFARFFYFLTIAVTLIIISLEVETIKAYFRGVSRYVYPTAYPFHIQCSGTVYWIFLGIEFIASYYIWAMTSGGDSVFALYTLELCGELRILASRFENLRTSNDYKIKLRECIERHHVIIKSRDALQNVFGFLSIWLAVTSAIVQCSLVFEAKMEVKTINTVFLFCYILMKLVQAFTYAWYGNLIAEESLLCMNAMYNAHWPGSGNPQFMSDVLIVLSQKPMIFRAKECMNLNMEIFIKVISSGWYFQVWCRIYDLIKSKQFFNQ